MSSMSFGVNKLFLWRVEPEPPVTIEKVNVTLRHFQPAHIVARRHPLGAQTEPKSGGHHVGRIEFVGFKEVAHF